MFTRSILLVFVVLLPAFGQLGKDATGWYNMVKGNILKSADKMPADQFNFKPTPEVRSFGQILAHVADANFSICAAAKGDQRERSTLEKTATDRAAIIKGLQESFSYCDGAYAFVTDAKAAEMTKFFGGERPRLGILNFNTMHDFEHYGNLVTYMRLKGVVPPSSEPRR